MTNAYDSIAQGLQEAIDLNDGKKVAAIRHNLGLTQMEFASTFCIGVSTWSGIGSS